MGVMNERWRFLPLLVAFVSDTLAACAISVFLCFGGHGTYIPAKLFFPYTMISTALFSKITPPFILLACVQFPAYGMVLAVANRRGCLKSVARQLGIIHLVAVALSFVFCWDALHLPHEYGSEPTSAGHNQVAASNSPPFQFSNQPGDGWLAPVAAIRSRKKI